MLDYSPLFGAFSEQTANQMVLVVAGTPDRTFVFTGTFEFAPADTTPADEGLLDGFDPSDIDSGTPLPSELQNLLDHHGGPFPGIASFDEHDFADTLTGLELRENGATVWSATGLFVPLGDGDGEQAIGVGVPPVTWTVMG